MLSFSGNRWNNDEEYEKWFQKALSETNKEKLTIDILMMIHEQCRSFLTCTDEEESKLSEHVEGLLDEEEL